MTNEGHRYRDLDNGEFTSEDPLGKLPANEGHNIMMPTDKWYLDGKEVLDQEYYRAIYAGTYVGANPSNTAKNTGVEAEVHAALATGDAKNPGQKSHYHTAIAGFPNLYTYVNQNPWTCFDPEGLDTYFLHMDSWPPHEYVQVGGDHPVTTSTPNATTYGFGPNSNGKMWGGGPGNVSSPDLWGHGAGVTYIRYKTTPAEEAKLKEYIEKKYGVNIEASPKNPNYNADWTDCRTFRHDVEKQLEKILKEEGITPETTQGGVQPSGAPAAVPSGPPPPKSQ